jgi:hypothetical protein
MYLGVFTRALDLFGLMRITEELLQKTSGSGLENRDYRPWGTVALTT